MGHFKNMDIEIQDCVEDLKQLRGVAPHNHPSNIVYGDGYFAKSIDAKYTVEVRAEAEKRLEVECTKLTIRITPTGQEILTNMIVDERSALRASRQYCLDDEVAENDEQYDALGELFEEITGHDLEPRQDT